MKYKLYEGQFIYRKLHPSFNIKDEGVIIALRLYHEDPGSRVTVKYAQGYTVTTSPEDLIPIEDHEKIEDYRQFIPKLIHEEESLVLNELEKLMNDTLHIYPKFMIGEDVFIGYQHNNFQGRIEDIKIQGDGFIYLVKTANGIQEYDYNSLSRLEDLGFYPQPYPKYQEIKGNLSFIQRIKIWIQGIN